MLPVQRSALLLCGALLAFLPGGVRAQDGTDPSRPLYFNKQLITFPFGQDRYDVRQHKLYISSNNGSSWELHATATPDQGHFVVRLEQDGAYAFATQSILTSGEAIPPTPDRLQAQKYIVVDTKAPVVFLQSLPIREKGDGSFVVGVKWDLKDDNLDPRSVRLDVRWVGQVNWVQVPTEARLPAQGDYFWTFQPDYRRMEVRLSARDKAGNPANQLVVVGSGVGPAVASGPDGSERFNTVGTGRAIARSRFTLVNKPNIALEYHVLEKGKSGIASVELWVTQNRTDWKKVEQAGEPQINGDKASLVFNAPQDGLYGFTMVARSGANIASQAPPTARDEPQIWVEVDTKPPEAKFLEVRFALPNDPRSMLVTWEAADKNLDVQPIILQYCEENSSDEKAWKDINPTGPLSNTGRYVFATPNLSGNAFKFYLRMKVFDRAGNQTKLVYDKPIVVDLVRPRVEITDAMPAKP